MATYQTTYTNAPAKGVPGLVANDFGDSIRFGASTADEDETDLSRVSLSLPPTPDVAAVAARHQVAGVVVQPVAVEVVSLDAGPGEKLAAPMAGVGAVQRVAAQRVPQNHPMLKRPSTEFSVSGEGVDDAGQHPISLGLVERASLSALVFPADTARLAPLLGLPGVRLTNGLTSLARNRMTHQRGRDNWASVDVRLL